MKKITLLLTVLMFVAFSWQSNAQFGCGSGIAITDGYTATAITTPGTGGAEDWNSPNPTNMGSTGVSASYWDDDVYLFEFTAGAVSEDITVEVFTRKAWAGLGVFTTCTGTAMDDAVAAMRTTSSNSALTVTATVTAGSTVYIAVGQYGTPNDLDFDVTSVSVVPSPTCAAVTALAEDTVTEAAANITWTDGVGCATAYTVNIMDTATSTAITGSPFTVNCGVETLALSGLTSTTEYSVEVVADCGANPADTITFTTAAPPPTNDNCDGAYAYTDDFTLFAQGACTGTPNTIDLAAATEDVTDYPSCDGFGNYGVWYTWTADALGLKFTSGAEAPGFTAYETGTCGSLVSVGCLNNTSGEVTGFTIGNDYVFYIWDDTVATTIDFCLEKIDFVNPVATYTTVNDCANTQFTVDVDVTNLGGASAVTVTDGTTSFPGVGLGIQAFGPYPEGTTVAFTVTSDDDVTYTSGDSVTFICPPANNDFVNAEPLTYDGTCVMTAGTNVGATASGMNVASCGSTDGTEGDVWYSFIGADDGNVEIETSVGAGANLDTVMALYSYDGTTLTQVVCSDDGTGIAPFSNISITDGSLVAGDTYYISVHEYNGDNTDTFNICIIATPTIITDECADATPLTVNPAGTGCASPEMIDNTGATDSSTTNGTPAVCANNGWIGGADVWYTITAPASGNILITTPTPSAWSSMMYAFYDTCADMTEVFCGANYDIEGSGGATSVVEGLTPGTMYYVRFWDYNQNTEGEVAICIEEAVVPVNDLCANPIPLTVGLSRNDNQVSGSNLLTTDSGEATPTCATYMGGDLWYSAVVPVNGKIKVETIPGNGDGGLAVYSGTCGGLTELACSDDEGDGLFGLVDLTGLTAGDTLLIRVWGFNGADISFNVVAYNPTCNVPTGFTLPVITETTADITWTAGSDGETMWDFEYGPTGFTQGTGIMQSEITTNNPNQLMGLTLGTTYDIYVRAVCVSGSDYSDWVGPISFTTLTPPPSNDDCATPATLTVYATGASAGNETAADSTGATASAQALTSCDATGINFDMFYEFTVPVGETEVYVLSSGDTGADIEVALFDSCGGTEVSGSCSNNGTEHIISGLTGGTTYLLQVWHDDFNAGAFTIAIESAPSCPVPLNFSLNNLTSTSVDVLWDAGGTETMWDFEYGVTGFTQGAGTMIIETTLNTGLNLSPLTDSTTYDIYVRAVCVSGSDNSTWVGPLNFTTPAPPPVNDDCAGAITIVCTDVVAGSTTSATPETIGSFTGAQEDANSVWYVFTGNGDAVTLSTCNDTGATPGDAAYDTKIDVYSSPSDCTTLTHIGGNDDGGSCTGFSSLYEFNSVTGTNYYVRVYGFSGFSSGDFNLSVECQAPCTPVEANQDCASATTLVRNGATLSLDSTCSTTNIVNPSCDGFGTIADLWFETTASGNGLLDITTTLGTATEINVAVYEGTCGALTEVATACAATTAMANSLALTGLTPNGIYYVQTWTSGETQEGTFDIMAGSSTVSVNNLESVGFNYYPNPVSNELHVTARENITSVTIYNMLGQEVQQITPSALEATVDMSNLAIGNYFVKAQVGNTIGTFKIIKK